MNHPAKETLRRFGRGEASPGENREVVTHLLRRCEPCANAVRHAMQPEHPRPEEDMPSRLMILRWADRPD